MFGSGLPRFLTGTPVLNLSDYSTVVRTVVQADYVPFTPYSNDPLIPLLTVLAESSNHTTDCFLIDSDLYILHFNGTFDPEEAYLSRGMITDRSIKRLNSRTFLKLLSVAASCLSSEMDGNRDYFKLNNELFRGDGSGTFPDTDQILQTAFEKLSVKVFHNGSSFLIDSPETFTNLFQFFCHELFEGSYACNCFWQLEDPSVFSEEGIRFVLELKDPNSLEEALWSELYLSPEGKLWVRKDSVAYMCASGSGVVQVSFMGRFMWSPSESFSFEKVVDILVQ